MNNLIDRVMSTEFELPSLVFILVISLLLGLIVLLVLLVLCAWQSCLLKENNEKIDGRRQEEEIGDATFNKAQSTDVPNNFKKTLVILDNKRNVKSILEPLSDHGISNKNKHEVKGLKNVANGDKAKKMADSKMIDNVVQPSKITQANQELKDNDEYKVSVPKTQTKFEIEEFRTENQDTKDFGSKQFDEDMLDELNKQGNIGDQKLKLSKNERKTMNKKKQRKTRNKKEIKANKKNECNVDVEIILDDGHDVTNYKSDENDENKLPPRKKIKRFKSSPPCLENLGNTCFLNSSLQVIYQTQILGHLLNEFNKEHSSEPIERRLQESMMRFYSNPDNPQEILNHVRNRFHNYKQEDSHDLITHLFQGIKEEQQMILAKSQYPNDKESLISVNKVFLGHMLRFSICTKCHQTHHVVQKIYDLSLPISFNLDDENSEIVDFPKESCSDNCFKVLYDLMVKEISLPGNDFTLERCLKHFTKREFGPNLCQHCYEMNPSTDDLPPAFSRTLYIDLPPVLMIYFMRFQQTQNGTFEKCNKSVQYPKILDLSPYMVLEVSHYRYSLYGVVEHSGSIESGHYVAYVKVREDSKDMLLEFINAKKFHKDHVTKEWLAEQLTAFGINKHEDMIIDDAEKEWYYTSDTYVKKINEQDAMNRKAILLFYEKIK